MAQHQWMQHGWWATGDGVQGMKCCQTHAMHAAVGNCDAFAPALTLAPLTFSAPGPTPVLCVLTPPDLDQPWHLGVHTG